MACAADKPRILYMLTSTLTLGHLPHPSSLLLISRQSLSCAGWPCTCSSFSCFSVPGSWVTSTPTLGTASPRSAGVTALPWASQAGLRTFLPQGMYFSRFHCCGYHWVPQDDPAGFGKCLLVLLRTRVLRGWKSPCQRLGAVGSLEGSLGHLFGSVPPFPGVAHLWG